MQAELLAGKGNARFDVRLIGYVPDKTIIVSIPPVHERKTKLFDGDNMAVRFLQGNDVHAFKTSIERVCTDPMPYMHLVFPSSIETARVRNSYRVNTSCPVSIQCNGNKEKHNAELIDISEDGAKIISDDILGNAGEKIKLEGRFSFAGIEEILILDAVIRNANNKPVNQHSYGIEFADIKQQDMMFLRGVIYEQIVKERGVP